MIVNVPLSQSNPGDDLNMYIQTIENIEGNAMDRGTTAILGIGKDYLRTYTISNDGWNISIIGEISTTGNNTYVYIPMYPLESAISNGSGKITTYNDDNGNKGYILYLESVDGLENESYFTVTTQLGYSVTVFISFVNNS